MSKYITISRLWHNPQIEIMVHNEGIELKMPLDDFVKAVKEEVGSVRWIFKDETFEAKLDAAIESVITGIKAESSKVM